MAGTEILLLALPLTMLPLGVAFSGGVYFGLHSCGGYAWEWELYCALFGSALIIWSMVHWLQLRLIKPFPIRRFALNVSAVTLVSALLYLFTMASAAPFYPATPENFETWWNGFLIALQDGPC